MPELRAEARLRGRILGSEQIYAILLLAGKDATGIDEVELECHPGKERTVSLRDPSFGGTALVTRRGEIRALGQCDTRQQRHVERICGPRKSVRDFWTDGD